MKIDQLAIFWRDRYIRCFTWFHFKPPEGETSLERAKIIINTLSQLSVLQIYGAALNYDPLLNPVLLVPLSEAGTEKRLQVDFYPDAPLQPRLGITFLKFSIPGPRTDLVEMGRSVTASSEWYQLEQEVVPFLCLPNGIGVAREIAGYKIYGLEFVNLPERKEPNDPVAAAISANEQHIEKVRAKLNYYQGTDRPITEKDYKRIDKYIDRIAWLQAVQQIEQRLFESLPAEEIYTEVAEHIEGLQPKKPEKPKKSRSTKSKPRLQKTPPTTTAEKLEKQDISLITSRRLKDSIQGVRTKLQQSEESFRTELKAIDDAVELLIRTQESSLEKLKSRVESEINTSPEETFYKSLQVVTNYLHNPPPTISLAIQPQEPDLSGQTTTVTELAKQLGLSTTTLRRWCRKGEIPAKKVDHKWLIDLKDVKSLLD